MRLLLISVIILSFHSFGKGQSNCSNPIGPINQNTLPPACYAISDSSDTLELCFTFRAPGSLLLFASVPPANCTTYDITAALYDSACNRVDSPAFGIVSVTSGASYTWCARYICTGSIGYGSQFCPSFSDFSPLPVTWMYFFGRYRNQEGAVRLSWGTATETRSDFFDVEHSHDAEHYYFIGREPAAGYSSFPLHYSLTDYHPGTVNFYRIRQVDQDGSFSLSNTICVFAESDSQDPAELLDITGRPVDILTTSPGIYLLRKGNTITKIVR